MPQTYPKLLGLKDTETINPLQELFINQYEENPKQSLVVSAPTGSGKSSSISIFGQQHLLAGTKIVYIAPTKALVEEKAEEFRTKYWADIEHKVGIVTGDYGSEDKTSDAIDACDIIVITPESFISRLRKATTHTWLLRVGLVIVDEAHLLADSSRGANIEVALMEYTQINPLVQLLLLSGTLVNYPQIVTWLETLTNKEVKPIVSTYRPHKTEHVFMEHVKATGKEGYALKCRIIAKIIKDHPDKQIIIPVFVKAFGRFLQEELRKEGIALLFHYGDLTLGKRKSIEKAFANKTCNYLACTQTLMQGVNVYADIGITTDTSVAGQDIPAYQIQQAAGRVGRFCDGKVFYLIPNNTDASRHKARFLKGEPITSALLDREMLMLHILGAIHSKMIYDLPSLSRWYKRSLAHLQGNKDTEKALVVECLQTLQKYGMILYDESGSLTVTHKGTITAQYMVSPSDIADWCRNLRKLYSKTKVTPLDLALAYGEVARYYSSYLTQTELTHVKKEVKAKGRDVYWKSTSMFLYKLNGEHVPEQFLQMATQFYIDANRCQECLSRINSECEKWTNESTFRTDFLRLTRGYNSKELDLVLLKIPKKYRSILTSNGLYTKEDCRNNLDVLKTLVDHDTLLQLI